MTKFLSKFLDAVFPNNLKCFVCGKEIPKNDAECVCRECSNRLPFIKNPCKTCGEELVAKENFCLRCQNRKRKFITAAAPFNYENDFVRLIHDFKYKNARWLAKHFADYIFKVLNKNKIPKANYLIPVPLCAKHMRNRGYNQAELLCEELNKAFKRSSLPEIKILNNALLRIKETKDQTELTAKERMKNMDGAFEISEEVKIKKLLKGKTIILTDDVFTTGATSEECAKILNKAGAKEVYVLTVCHTKFKNII